MHKILIKRWRSTGIRMKLKKIVAQYLYRRKVQRRRSNGDMVKLVIGSGGIRYEGWLTTDLPVFDALNSTDWSYIFTRESIDRILAEHVVEHWNEDDFRLFLRIVRPFLSEQGFIRIAVPDGFHPDLDYINYVTPGGGGYGAGDHKILYNCNTIVHVLSEEQYDCHLLEYFDEAGQFHRSPWSVDDGFVERSADYDSRNRKRPLSYTSLIVDAWKRGSKYEL